jgi:hypothetical protein
VTFEWRLNNVRGEIVELSGKKVFFGEEASMKAEGKSLKYFSPR